jgi:hypothetical protein
MSRGKDVVFQERHESIRGAPGSHPWLPRFQKNNIFAAPKISSKIITLNLQ